MKSRRSPRFIATVLTVRATQAVMRLFGLKATHFPGQLAKKLCPGFLAQIAKPDRIIAVTGTNGKTTVANLVADMAGKLGLSFAHNAYGSNIEEGIITALLDATTVTGRKKKELAILEIDERVTRVVFKDLQPDYLLVTNLFRESYLRNAHGEFIYQILDDHIPASTRLIVNADDLLSSALGRKRPHNSFGIAQLPEEATFTRNLIRDVLLCPDCGQPLTDDFIRYHHVGRSRCDACGWRSMEADYQVLAIRNSAEPDRTLAYQAITRADTLVVGHRQADGRMEEESYPFSGQTILDLYNVLAAITLFKVLGYEAAAVADALTGLTIGMSRKEIVRAGNKTIYRMLAKGKNPIAVSRVIDAVTLFPGDIQFILLVDTSVEKMSEEDNTAWLYDADLALLSAEAVRRIVIGGQRAEDIRLALLLAGVPDKKIVTSRDKSQTASLIEESPAPQTIAILYELYSEAVSRKVTRDLKDRLARPLLHQGDSRHED